METVAIQDRDEIAYAPSVASRSDKEKSAFTTDVTSYKSGDSEGKGGPHMQFLNTDDPFPESPDSPIEDQQLTVRAVLVGCMLGGIIAASNIYLGLKVSDPSRNDSCLDSFVHADRMDVWRILVRLNPRLRHLETTVKNRAYLSWRRLFRAERKQRLSIGCNISRKPRVALHLGFPSRVPARTAERPPQGRHRQINHFYHLLRLLWFELHSAPEKVLHSEAKARVSLRRSCCIYDSVLACRQERRSDGKEENQGADLRIHLRHHPTRRQRVCSRRALGLACFLLSE